MQDSLNSSRLIREMRVEQVMIKETASLELPPKHLAPKQTKQRLPEVAIQTKSQMSRSKSRQSEPLEAPKSARNKNLHKYLKT